MKNKNKYDLKHKVDLAPKERELLRALTKKGKHHTRVIARAQILLKSDDGWIDADIAPVVGISIRTVESVRARYAEGGCDRALYDAPRPGQPPKLDDKAEAHLIALACSDAPEGRAHWTLELLRERMVTDKKVSVSTVALWKRLTRKKIKPWREKNVVHSEGHA